MSLQTMIRRFGASDGSAGLPRMDHTIRARSLTGERHWCQFLGISCHRGPLRALMTAIEQLLMPNTYIKLMAQVARDRARLMHGTGLTAADILTRDEPITVRQQLICARNAAAMAKRPDWHFAWATNVAEHFHGPVTAAWLSAPTLGDGLEVFVKYIHTRIPYLAWRGETSSSMHRCEVRALMDLGDIGPTLIEIPMLALLQYVKTLRGGRIQQARVEFAHAPIVTAERYRQRFRCDFAFNARCSALVIPRAWLQIPNAGHDDVIWAAALRRCETAAPISLAAAAVAAVRQTLQRSFEARAGGRVPPTLADVAAHLHISVRTLNRRLSAAHASYQELVDEARKQRAGELLSDPRRRVADVAVALGYQDPASFGRAFKRWYGTTPGRLRNARPPAGA